MVSYKTILKKMMDTRSPKTGLTRREYTELYFKGKKGAPEIYQKMISTPLFKKEKARADKILKSGKDIAKYLLMPISLPLMYKNKKGKK